MTPVCDATFLSLLGKTRRKAGLPSLYLHYYARLPDYNRKLAMAPVHQITQAFK